MTKFKGSTFSITPSDVKCALRKIKKRTSTGVDLVSAKHFENASDLLVEHISLLFQMSIYSSVGPQQFCIGQITLIPKKGKRDIEDCQSHQRITISFTLFKIFECTILSKMSCMCYAPMHPFDFQKELGSEDAIYSFFNVLADVEGSGNFYVLCALYIARAFEL